MLRRWADDVPFTGSHPAAVLPLMRWGLVPSALVIGSVVPDLPYYLPVPVHAGTTHSPAGTVGVDVALGAAVFVLWHTVLAPFALAVAPSAVRDRVAAWTPWTPRSSRGVTPVLRSLTLAALSLAVGAATHTGWDAFTHYGRWGTRHVGWLAASHAGLPGYRWAQYAGGVLGAAAIGVWLLRWWRTSRPAAGSEPRAGAAAWTVRAAWAVVVAAGVAGGLAAGVPARGDEALRLLFQAGTGAVGAGVLAAVLFAAGWAVARRVRR